jgi:hypothetical protein
MEIFPRVSVPILFPRSTLHESEILTTSQGLGFHYWNLDSAQQLRVLITVIQTSSQPFHSFPSPSPCHPLIFSSFHWFFKKSGITLVSIIEPMQRTISFLCFVAQISVHFRLKINFLKPTYWFYSLYRAKCTMLLILKCFMTRREIPISLFIFISANILIYIIDL